MQIDTFYKKLFSNDRRFLTFIFLVALVFRLAFILAIENKYYFSDSLQYEDCARSILKGNGFGDFPRAPLYCVWMATVFSVFGEGNVLAIRITEAVLGSCLCVVLFFLGKMLYSKRAGSIAAFAMAFYPIFIFLPSLNYPTLICALLVTFGTLCVVLLNTEGKIWLAVTAGILFSLAALAVAPTATLLVPVLFSVLVLSNFSFKKKWAFVGLMTLAFAITQTPWTIRNFLYHGKFVPIRPGGVEHMSFYEDGKVNYEKREQTNLDEKLKSMQENSSVFISHYSRRFLRFWRIAPSRHLTSADPNYNLKIHGKDKRITKSNKFSRANLTFIVNSVTFGPILFFAILGLFFINSKNRKGLILILLPLTLALTYSFFYTNLRYRLPIEPLLIVFASNSFVVVLEFLKNRLRAELPSNSDRANHQKSKIAGSKTV